MQLFTVTAKEAGQRLDKYLAKCMGDAPKGFLYKMMRKKNITLNGKKAAGMEKVAEGDRIAIFLSDGTIAKFRRKPPEAVKPPTPAKLDIIFEDEDILVINKPQGMLSQKAEKGDNSLIEYIASYLRQKGEGGQAGFSVGICNRLDRNTTGLVVAGKSIAGLQCFNRLFKERELKKYYLCLVKGTISKQANICGYLAKDQSKNRVAIHQEKYGNAVQIATAYEPLVNAVWNGQDFTLLKVHLITGKPHQIRAHLQSIGHPVAGDAKYGGKKFYDLFQREFGIRYQLLHAWKFCLGQPDYLPEKYRNIVWKAPLPEQFAKVLKAVGIRNVPQ